MLQRGGMMWQDGVLLMFGGRMCVVFGPRGGSRRGVSGWEVVLVVRFGIWGVVEGMVRVIFVQGQEASTASGQGAEICITYDELCKGGFI